MRKGLTTLLVILLAVGAMLVSCKAEVVTPADELVSASFELDSSRALSATLEQFEPSVYYWKYAAKKNVADTSGLTSGSTATYDEAGALPVSAGNKGLGATSGETYKPYKVPDFSQGIWDFMLFAYKTCSGSGTATDPYVYSDLVYKGEATAATLVKNGPNMVHVVVSPLPTGNGTLVIGATSLKPRETTDTPTVSRSIKVEDLNGQQYYPTTGTTYELAAAAYKVTVSYMASGILYAEGTVIATVYPNMTTTVSGTVDELVTYAQFEAEQNPDIIARTAEVDGIKKSDTATKYDLEDTSSETAKVSATIPAVAAKALINSTDPTATMSLALNVDTVDSTSTSVTYEIGMTKTITVNSQSTTSDVTNVDAFVSVEITLRTGLTGVAVKHGTTDMTPSATKTAYDESTVETFFYDSAAGKLYIKTMSFSPFAVTYDGQTAGVAEVNGVKYATLKAAVEAAKSGDTVKLLSDAEGDGMSINKNLTIDLNGKTYTGTKDPAGSTGTKTQLFQLLEDNTVTIKNGKLTSTAGSGIKMLVQNYSSLTLTNVILDGSNLGEGQYTLSNNSGVSSISGATSIIAPPKGIAFDVCSGWGGYTSCTVNLNTTGTITGDIEVSDWKNNTVGVYLNIEAAVFSGDIIVPEWTDKIHINKVCYNANTNVWYDDLQTAINAATAGNTIKIFNDIEISQVISVSKSLIIEGNNHSLFIPTNAPSSVTRVFNFDGNTNDIEFTLNNTVVDARTAKRERAISFYDNSGKVVLNINHSTISSDYYAINVASKNTDLTVNIDNSTCSTGWCAIQTWSANSVFNIRNSELSGLNDKPYAASHYNDFSTVVFNGDATGAVATFENCVIKAKQTTGNKQTLVSFRATGLVNNYVDCRFYVDDQEITDDIGAIVENWNFTSWDAVNTATLVINGVQILPEESELI